MVCTEFLNQSEALFSASLGQKEKKKHPTCLLDVVKFAAATSVFPKSIVNVSKRGFIHEYFSLSNYFFGVRGLRPAAR